VIFICRDLRCLFAGDAEQARRHRAVTLHVVTPGNRRRTAPEAVTGTYWIADDTRWAAPEAGDGTQEGRQG
jgi:hypothetical protein